MAQPLKSIWWPLSAARSAPSEASVTPRLGAIGGRQLGSEAEAVNLPFLDAQGDDIGRDVALHDDPIQVRLARVKVARVADKDRLAALLPRPQDERPCPYWMAGEVV